MAKMLERATVVLMVKLELNEDEVCALHALSQFGVEALIKAEPAFKQHEEGLLSLYHAIRRETAMYMYRARAAREFFEGPWVEAKQTDIVTSS